MQTQQGKPNLIFLYGAPATAKSTVAQQVAAQTGFEYLNLEEFYQSKKCQNENDRLNSLMKHLTNQSKNFIIDGFLDSKAQAVVFFEHFNKPRYVIYFQSSKDEIEQNILLLSTPEQRKIRIKNLQSFLKYRDDMLAYLKKQQFFVTVDAIQKGLSNNFKESSQLIVNSVMKFIQPKVMVALTYNNEDLAEVYLNKLEKEEGYIQLHVESLCEEEAGLKTPLGKQISAFLNSGQVVPAQMQIELLKKVLYQDPSKNKFILLTFPEKHGEFKQFEEKLFPIDGLMSFMKEGKNVAYSAKINPVLQYIGEGRHLTINKEDTSQFKGFITKRTKFGIVVGAQGSGKTTLAKFISQRFGYQLIEWEPTINILKEKLAKVPGEPLEEVTVLQIIEYYTQLFSNVSNDKYVFDGFPPGCEKVEQFMQIGAFSWVLNIEMSIPTYWIRYKIKNELDAAQEITPEDEEKLQGQSTVAQVNLKSICAYVEAQNDCSLFSLDTNQALDTTFKSVEYVFEKRVYLARVTASNLTEETIESLRLVFINIAARHDMTFVDVEQVINNNIELLANDYEMRWTKENKQHPSNFAPETVLRLIRQHIDSLPQTRRDVILWGYSSADYKGNKQDDELLFPRATDELVYIEKQLGTIRMVYVISEQLMAADINDPEWVLEKPVVEVPKVEGDDADADAKDVPKDDEEDNKPKFNIFDHQWTKSDVPKNMAQIFMKVKQPTTANLEVSDYSYKMIYDNFEELYANVVEQLQHTYFIQVQLQNAVME